MTRGRWAILVLLAAAITAFFVLGGPDFLSLQRLQTELAQWQAWQAAHPVQATAAFFLLYVTVTALSVPGATVLTLAAGALFGLWKGTLIVSFASSIGALAAFLTARYLLREAVQRRFAERLEVIDAGIERDGALYLFSLRMVPIFPFFLINLAMGLTAIRAWTFYWVSQLGMLAGTMVYVNAGRQLASLQSLSGILSPPLWASFALLGIFPWLAKTAVTWVQRKHRYAPWSRPKRFDRNLIVIGGGAAGLVTAYIAAATKATVTLVERRSMGGDCLNHGCVPSKALIAAANLAHRIRHADRLGIACREPRIHFPTVVEHIRTAIERVAPHDSVERYTALGVDVRLGHARLLDPWTVEITAADGAQERLTARSIVLATGAEPLVPPLPGLEETGYLTSETLWDFLAQCTEPPRRLVVLGGGPIGCELSQAFARLGSDVTQVVRSRLMPREDDDVADFVQKRLEADGVTVLLGHTSLRCEKRGDRKTLVVQGPMDSTPRSIPFDALLVAVGRTARLEGYGLETLGIPTHRTIDTNVYLETIYPNIFAAGDAAGPYQFTHSAGHQAWYAAVNALFGTIKRFAVDFSVIPWVTFEDPEVARVGINEREAQKQGIAYEVTRYSLTELDRAITEGTTEGFLKVLTVPGKDRILGATIVSPHAGEMLAEFVLAMKHGLGLSKILGTIHAYPSWVEANKNLAGQWKLAHAPERLLAWVERYHQWMRG